MQTPTAARGKRGRIALIVISLVALFAGHGPAEAALTPEAAHDLAALKILSRAVVQVQDHYVDPRRIDPKEMIVSALDYVEKTVAEVMVEGEAKTNKLKVTVGSATKDFDIG